MASQSSFECSSCGKRYRWQAQHAGRKFKCACEAVLRVPQEDPAAVDELAALDQREATAQPSAQGGQSCPSCGADAAASAVLCVNCGYNFQTGKAEETVVARAVKQGGGGNARHVDVGEPDGFFGRMSRSWEFAKISYGIIWDFKSLLIFPLLSLTATIIVMASFLLPLWGTGDLAEWMKFLDDEGGTNQVPPVAYVLTFAFYFACYFVIVFFNTALTAAALKVCDGETPTVKYGLSVATRRLPQILGWALVSAVVGVLLKVIENANERVGQIVSAILGTAWTVLTFFVVPVLCTEGVGPVKAVTESVKTLKSTWGEAALGNFSLGILSFLVMIPVYLVLGLLFMVTLSMNSMAVSLSIIVLAVVITIVLALMSSAADVVFKALLYNYATGRNVPADLDDAVFERAFAAKA